MTSPSVSTQYFTAFEPPNPLQLEGGQTLGPITQAYESYGTLNEAKDNCILVCHALTGDAHAAFSSAEDESYIGWGDSFIGPEKANDYIYIQDKAYYEGEISKKYKKTLKSM